MLVTSRHVEETHVVLNVVSSSPYGFYMVAAVL